MSAERILYRFTEPRSRQTQEFVLTIDRDTGMLVDPPPAKLPEWARLEYQQCAGCPLAKEQSPYCPAAAHLSSLIEHFAHVVSFNQVEVAVETAERTISTRTTAQQALASLIGLLLAACGCPNMAAFRPMARFHLPFANESETTYRVVSMYLVAQYFASREGRRADLDLKDLALVYRGVHQVNLGLVQRLRAATTQDAIVNAVVLLDVYTSLIPAGLDELMNEFKSTFDALLTAPMRSVDRSYTQ